MNNDRSPAWKMEKVVTINSEFSLCGLMWKFYKNLLISYMGRYVENHFIMHRKRSWQLLRGAHS